jgi:hypothetical protein
MAKKVWTLTDAEQKIYVEQVAISPGDVGGPAKGYSVTKR